MRSYYFVLPGGAVQPVLAPDLNTAVKHMRNQRVGATYVMSSGAFRLYAARLHNEGAETPACLPALLAREKKASA